MEVSGQFNARVALLPEKEPSVPLDRKLSGPQSRSGRGDEEKKFLASVGNWTSLVQPVASHYTDWAISAPNFNAWRLLFCCFEVGVKLGLST
jgi:hypothetical protein